MARNSRYRVQPRRRREGKTDYKARKALVLSGKYRFVARTTLRNVTTQIISANPKGDLTLCAAHSRELEKKYGWRAPKDNIPAAYLTGLICGLKARAKGITEAILDIGLYSPSQGSRIFAALNGAADGGLNVPFGKEKLDKLRIKGEHIANYAKSMESGSANYQSFSQYLTKKLPPEELPEHFEEVRSRIISAFERVGDQA